MSATDGFPTRADCPMPTPADVRRTTLILARQSLLDDDCEDVAREYLVAKAGDEKAAILGIPDTSANPIASAGRQLSTPGLYGTAPKIRHADPAAGPLFEQVALSGWLTRMQHTQLMAWALGEWFLRFDIPRDVGHVTVRAVSPVDVYVESNPDLPDVPVVLWERRCRYGPDGKWAWFWDRYDRGERSPDGTGWRRPPSYNVVAAIAKDGVREDFSAYFLPGAPPGGFVGDAYPFMLDGVAFLPWATYRAIDTGRKWNHDANRGITKGSLNAMMLWTYASYAALGATGRVVLAINCEFGASVQQAPNDQSQTARVKTIPLTPGSILQGRSLEGTQPMIQEVGPGADLDKLADYAQGYELSQYVRAGLNPADVTRTAANPTSGSALAISDKGRREYADRVRPLFERVDQQALTIIAKLMRITGMGQPPLTGYTIEYHAIPETPGEQAARREARDADMAAGRLSPIDAYMDDHPGLSREAAQAALVQIAVEKARLDRAIADAIAGISPAEIEDAAEVEPPPAQDPAEDAADPAEPPEPEPEPVS